MRNRELVRSRRAGVLSLTLTLTVALALPACGDDDGSGDPVLSDCTRACAVPEACLGDGFDEAACRLECVGAVTSYGELGALAIDYCADCLQANDCVELAAGACDDACPTEAGIVVDIPPEPGVGCTENWQEGGHAWTVRCDWDEYDQLYDCQCFEDSVSSDYFDSLDFCQVQTPAQMTQANAGCYWGVGLREGCNQNWYMNNENYGVGCTGTTTGWDCECYNTYPEVLFQTDQLCDLDFAGRTALANTECGFGLDGLAPCEYTWSPVSSYLTVRCDQGQCQCYEDEVATGASFSSGEFCIQDWEPRAQLAETGCGWDLTP